MYLALAITLGIVTGLIASSKGHPFFRWFLLGFFLPIIGIVAAILAKNKAAETAAQVELANSRKCPFCAEVIKLEAVVCKHCGRDIPPATKDDALGIMPVPTPAPVPVYAHSAPRCPKCGDSNYPDSKRCRNCGEPLS